MISSHVFMLSGPASTCQDFQPGKLDIMKSLHGIGPETLPCSSDSSNCPILTSKGKWRGSFPLEILWCFMDRSVRMPQMTDILLQITPHGSHPFSSSHYHYINSQIEDSLVGAQLSSPTTIHNAIVACFSICFSEIL
jgi:hypothetical protein